MLLLADAFENSIFTSLKYYNLDPCHYFSAPGLSWYAMLKMSDADINLFIEKGMIGCISNINKRYSKANNEYCTDYNKNKPKVYINYLDMNNLYGGAMSEYLPYGCYKWVKVNNEVVNRIL